MDIYKGDLDPDLELTLADDDGPMNLLDADDVVVNVRKPDGSLLLSRRESLNEVEVDNDGRLSMPWVEGDTVDVGRHTVQVLVEWPTGPQSIDVDEVVWIKAADVGASLVSIEELIEHMSGITLTPFQRNAGRIVLRGAERGLERQLARSLTARTHVQTVSPLRPDGWVPLASSPVIELVSVDGDTDADLLAAYRLTRDGMHLTFGGPVTVVYRAGFDLDPDDLADVQLAILEKASGVMTDRHDDTLSVKALETRDDVETARKVAATWSKDEVEPFDRLRRRVVA